jgi:hypothetical protein
MSLTRRILIACLLLLAPKAGFADAPPVYALPALGEDLDGTWAGSFEGAGMNLNVAFNIKSTGAKADVTVDVLDQQKGIPVSAASREGTRVRFEMKDLGGVFEGALSGDRSAIQGTWVQVGKRIPLSLKRRADAQSKAATK